MFSPVVERSVFAHGEEPGGETVAVERGEGLRELDEDLLCDVAGLVDLADDAQGVADERTLEAVEGCDEKRMVRITVGHEVFGRHHG